MRKFLGALILAATCSVTLIAQSPRRIDFTQILKSIDGKPIVAPGAKTPLTLSDVAINALEEMTTSDQRSSGMERFHRDQLAREIWKNKTAALSPEDVALIKERIGEVYGPVVVGAAWPLLDPSVDGAGH